MPGFTDYGARKFLDHLTLKTAYTPPAIYLGLFTVMPLDTGASGTEVTGGGYARKQIAGTDWNAAAGSAPATATNVNAISFAASTGSWSSGSAIVGWGLFDAVSAGNMLFTDWLGANVWKPFSGTNASPSALTAPAHGFVASDSVVVTPEYGGSLPTVAADAWKQATTGLLTVSATALTTDVFNVTVNSTSTGSGLVRKVDTQIVNASNITVTINASSFTLSLA